MSDVSADVARIHGAAKALLETPCDLLDIERRVVEVYGHKLLAIDLWISPVLQDEPIYHLGIIADPEGALAVHLLSPEQYAAAFQPTEAPAEVTPDQETNSNG